MQLAATLCSTSFVVQGQNRSAWSSRRDRHLLARDRSQYALAFADRVIFYQAPSYSEKDALSVR